MYVYFIFKNNTFNFDIKKDVSILYLKNLASKLINQDKSTFDLFYNNQLLSEESISLFQISKNETKIPIIISPKKKNNSKKLPILKLSNHNDLNNTERNDQKNNLFTNDSELFSDYSLKDQNNNTKSFIRLKTGLRSKQKNSNSDYISINKVFEDVYRAKEEEIINLNKTLCKKLLEYDDIIYKKYKSSLDKDNNQLLEYEKNVIDFKNKQIEFLKKLINFFETTDSNVSNMGTINLEEFYLELSNYNNKNKNIFIQNNFNYNQGKNNTINNKKIKYISLNKERFPKIQNIKNKEDDLIQLNKISEDSTNNDDILKKKSEKILSNKKPKKLILLQEKNRNESKGIKNNNTYDKKLVPDNDLKIENIKKNSSSKQTIFEKNKNQNINSLSKNFDLNVINRYSSKSLNDPSNYIITSRLDTENLNYNKNKVNVLYEISENKNENTENNLDSSNSDEDNNSQEKININKNNNSNNNNNEDLINNKEFRKEFNRRTTKIIRTNRSIDYSRIKNSRIGYMVKIKERKVNQRVKKLGNNIYDFLI